MYHNSCAFVGVLSKLCSNSFVLYILTVICLFFQAVRIDNKQRLGLVEEDGELWIRANQGHSVKVSYPCRKNYYSCRNILDSSKLVP